MPKKSRRRTSRTRPLVVLIGLAAVALVAGWWFLSPRTTQPPRHRRTVAVATIQPTLAPPPATETPEPVESPAAAGSETPSPEPSAPSAAPSQAPLGSPLPRVTGNGPMLALIVDDCGQWIDTERGFVALDVPLTVSVLPDVHYTGTIAQEAANAGKGVMLHLPMETISGMNPGPGKVTTEMSDAAIAAQVEADLAQVPLAQGVNNHEGSKASADERVMRDVIGVISKRGNLFFIDSRTNAASVGQSVAQAAGVPTAGRDVFLDNQLSVAYTEGQLREAAAIAKRTGSAIAIGHPRATTLAAVRAMIPELQAQGIRFVLARELVATSQQ